MIVDVGLSPWSPLDVSTLRLAYAAESVRRVFLESLLAHGCIVVGSASDLALLGEITRDSDLTPGERTRWREALEYLKKQNRVRVASPELSCCLDDIETPDELLGLGHALPLVCVVGSDAFSRLFEAHESGVAPIGPDASLATSLSASESEAIAAARALADKKKYGRGTLRDVVWAELFARPASVSSRIVICDRYLLRRLADGRQRRDPEHLTWLLEHLSRAVPDGARVVLYTEIGADGVPSTARGAAELVTGAWSPRSSRVRTIEIVGAPRWRRTTHPHNRHIRFGSSFGFQLDEGLDRLDSREIDAEAGFAYTYRWLRADLAEMSREERLVANSRGSDSFSFAIG